MTVEVTSLGQSGSPPIVNFQDTFHRADVPFYLGPQWWAQQSGWSPNGDGVDLDAAVNVGSGVGFGGTAAAGLFFYSQFFPAIVNVPVIRKRSLTGTEFAELRFLANTAGSGVAAGPMVYGQPSSDSCYWLAVNSVTRHVTQVRNLGTPQVTLAGFIVASPGDVLRIQVQLDPVGGNIVKTIQNGVVVQTTIDTPGLGPQIGGMHGIAYLGGAIGLLSFDNYSGGLL